MNAKQELLDALEECARIAEAIDRGCDDDPAIPARYRTLGVDAIYTIARTAIARHETVLEDSK